MPAQLITSERLEHRRHALGISKTQLARHSGVSFDTLCQVLGGQIDSVTVANIQAVLSALGAELTVSTVCTSYNLRRRQAIAKAEKIMAMVQGTSALEGQAVDSELRQDMVQRTADELMAGSRRRLWAT
jgi:transcriptional regulator with XRE-family HTH domain